MEKLKSKQDILKEMQVISEDFNKYKNQVEDLLKIIDDLEKRYYELAEEMRKN